MNKNVFLKDPGMRSPSGLRYRYRGNDLELRFQIRIAPVICVLKTVFSPGPIAEQRHEG